MAYAIIALAFLNMYLGYRNVQLGHKLSGSKKELTFKSKEYRNERIWIAVIVLQIIIIALDGRGYRFADLTLQITSLGLMVKLLIHELLLKRKKDK